MADLDRRQRVILPTKSSRCAIRKTAACSALVTSLISLAWMAMAATPAFAAFTHSTVEKTFAAGSPCSDIAVHEAAEIVYVRCGNIGTFAIEKYDFNGNPVNFTAPGPGVTGNRITFDPENCQNNQIGRGLAVDNSSAHNGLIYSASNSNANLSYYLPSGAWAGAIEQPVSSACGFITDSIQDVDVRDDGWVYASAEIPADRVSKYDPLFTEKERLYINPVQYGEGLSNRSVSVDSTGAVWVGLSVGGINIHLRKYEADQFRTNIKTNLETQVPVIESLLGSPSPFFASPLLVGSGEKVDVDPVTDDLYVPIGGQIRTYSPGTATMPPYQKAPLFGGAAVAIDVLSDHRVFTVTSGGTVTRYGTGDILPDISTHVPNVDDVGHTEALLKGDVDLAGGDPVTDCKLQIGKTTAYANPEVACSPAAFGSDEAVSSLATGLDEGATYNYRFKATTAKGTNYGINRTVVPAFVLKVKTLAATEVEQNEATLNGSMDPDGMPTDFYFEYGVDTSYGQSTATQSAGSGVGITAVDAAVSGLPEGKLWHYRLVAKNAKGTTVGPDATFRTASVPDLAGVRASEVKATSAVLNARIDPVGFATEYHFEYGTTPAYGQSIPVPDEAIGAGSTPVDVSKAVEGLMSGVTYHFRVVATNKWGTSASSDTTFDFSPPGCPNDHVRQQTRSSYLPDCRAYELVSPGNPGAVLFYPSQEAWDVATSFIGRSGIWHLNTGRATSPPRFSYYGAFGSVGDTDAPNYFLDLYVATRKASGWETTGPTLGGSEATWTGQRQCSESFSVCIDHKEGGYDFSNETFENAPYMFDIEGQSLGRLPTNLKVIPGGEYFNGEQRLSPDGGSYVFSSSNVVFTPDGVLGGLGSAYDNDLADQTVTVISKLPNGDDIPKDGTSTKPISFPGLSPNGSRVLMQTPAAGSGLFHLYMRDTDAGLTYDVARGAGARLAGVTRDGSRVFFMTTAKLTVDDTDSGDDLYMWRESGDSLSRISQGNGAGDSNSCAPTWTSGCGVQPLSTERGYPDGRPSIPGLDDMLAEVSGDVYFLSPELLDPTMPGIPNQQNLYVFRDNQVQLVTTLDAGTKINRIQISPDGAHAAMVTASRLTSYDNNKLKQMYTYDADLRQIRCASCNPSGLRPAADVEASQGGPFMSDDGRAFFATKDTLVPRDANGEIIDVYEFVGGRPQLITSGQASRDYTGGSAVLDLVTVPVFTGLEAVSADGSDVFFSTYDTLVPQDENGEFVKFYTARTAGGFPFNPDLAPCVAADECHGADSSPPGAAVIATGTDRGTEGNLRPPKQTKRKKGAAKRGKAKRKKAARHRNGRRKHG